MNPFVSWAILLVVVGGLSWHYSGRPNLLQKLGPTPSISGEPSTASKTKNRRRGDRQTLNGDEKSARDAIPVVSDSGSQGIGINGSKRRKDNDFPLKNNVKAAPASGIAPLADADDTEDFAKQMAQARQGTKLASSSGPSKKEKRTNKATARLVEQEKADPAESPIFSTGGTSSTGGDADDDLSPIGSPPLEATKAGDVTDMLEPNGKGPSVIRLTQSKQPTQSSSKIMPKNPQQEETKKQRQARKKRDAQKEQIEEAERHRKQLMEKQIQGARMAAGTSNQQRANAFASRPPKENVWQTVGAKSTTNAHTKTDNQTVPLLDTFDDDAVLGQGIDGTSSIETKESAASISSRDEPSGPLQESVNALKKAVGIGGETKPVDGAWMENMPSEEEQMRQLQNDQNWATVTTKKKKGKLGKENEKTEDLRATPAWTDSSTGNNATVQARPNRPQQNGSYSALKDEGFQDSEWTA